jgi:hypothetical protein
LRRFGERRHKVRTQIKKLEAGKKLLS